MGRTRVGNPIRKVRVPGRLREAEGAPERGRLVSEDSGALSPW